MYIGIDLGSSFVKLAVIDNGIGKIEKRRTVRIDTGKPYEYEYDIEDMLSFIREGIDSLTVKDIVEGIIFSTQMHGFILEKDGKATNYISWQDERSLIPSDIGECTLDRLKRSISQESVLLGGVNLKCELSLCGAVSFFENSGENPADYIFYTLGSYMISRLTGKNITHITNAAPTGMYDIYNRCWNTAVIDGAGLSGLELPEVTDEISVCGYYDGIPVYPDIGDQQATILGGGLNEGELNINIGTASQMSMICGPEHLTGNDISEIRPYFNGRYLRVVSKLPGGRSLQVLADFFADVTETFTGKRISNVDIWSKIEENDTFEETDLNMSLGFFKSLLYDNGEIGNISSDNLTVRDMICAAYDNMARCYISVIPEFKRETIDNIRICGKFAKRVEKSLYHLDQDENRVYCPVCVGETVFAGLKKLIAGISKNKKEPIPADKLSVG